MSKVALGVNNVAYTDEDGGMTTGEVAEILEKKYDVMGVFVQLHKKAILDDVSNTFLMMLKRYMATGQAWGNHSEFPLERTDAAFRDYLGRDEWQRETGKVIMAARKGVNHRKKHPYAKANGPRPAFIDTGLYRRSFRAFLKK